MVIERPVLKKENYKLAVLGTCKFDLDNVVTGRPVSFGGASLTTLYRNERKSNFYASLYATIFRATDAPDDWDVYIDADFKSYIRRQIGEQWYYIEYPLQVSTNVDRINTHSINEWKSKNRLAPRNCVFVAEYNGMHLFFCETEKKGCTIMRKDMQEVYNDGNGQTIEVIQ